VTDVAHEVTPPETEGAAVGAVVVNYNAHGHLDQCIRSLRADGVGRIAVVDNASTDGSEARLRELEPDATVLRLSRNVGYGAGANRGAAVLDTPYLLILNPDTIVEPGMVKALTAALDAHPTVGAVGPRVDTPAGEVYPSARTFPGIADALGHGFLGIVWPSNPFTRRYRMLGWDHADAREVDWISGACFLVRRTAFDAVVGFDESYFMYSEDVDLCWRLRRAGWDIYYEPAGRVMHAQGASTEHHPFRMIAAHHISLLRFAGRSTRGPKRLLLPVVAVGLGVRAMLVALRRAFGRRTL
jgi:N-acetylglucosaminyl-diphospho-decaprenol L-rhamnosyltransferase